MQPRCQRQWYHRSLRQWQEVLPVVVRRQHRVAARGRRQPDSEQNQPGPGWLGSLVEMADSTRKDRPEGKHIFMVKLEC
jgi:hypothetical protein